MRHQSSLQTTEVWECNWKIAITNAMESYHLFKVHPTTLEPYTPTRGAYYITGSARATATGGANRDEEDYLLISLPPGFVGVCTRDSFVWQAVSPAGTHRCAVRTGGAFASPRYGGALGGLGKWFTNTVGAGYALPDFLSEDKAICERIQRGFSGDFVPGRLLPVERVVDGLWALPQLADQRCRTARDTFGADVVKRMGHERPRFIRRRAGRPGPAGMPRLAPERPRAR